MDLFSDKLEDSIRERQKTGSSALWYGLAAAALVGTTYYIATNLPAANPGCGREMVDEGSLYSVKGADGETLAWASLEESSVTVRDLRYDAATLPETIQLDGFEMAIEPHFDATGNLTQVDLVCK